MPRARTSWLGLAIAALVAMVTFAMAMGFAGMSYVTEHHDPARFAENREPFADTFESLTRRAQTCTVRDSMHKVQDQYLGRLALFETASRSAKMARSIILSTQKL